LAVKIRLHRMGRKKLPFYRIVATDSRSRRDGKYLDKIGSYNPRVEPVEVVIDKEKALKWLKVGAKPSDTVRNLFSKQGILFEWDLVQRGFTAEQIAEEFKKYEAVQAQRQKRIEAEQAMLKREQEHEVKKAKAKKVQEDTEAPAQVEKPAAVEGSESQEPGESSENAAAAEEPQA